MGLHEVLHAGVRINWLIRGGLGRLHEEILQRGGRVECARRWGSRIHIRGNTVSQSGRGVKQTFTATAG